MTPATQQALSILRSPDHFQWYLVPMLAFVIYAYVTEVERGRWDAVFAGLILSVTEFTWEIGNALLVPITGYSALWVTPGDTAYLILVGLTIEIFLMFSVAGLILVKLLPADRTKRIGGIPNRWLIPIGLGLFCVGIESTLNQWGALVWDWRFWSWPHLYLLVVGYCAPFLIVAWIYDRWSLKAKAIFFGCWLSLNVVLWLVCVTWLKII